MLFPPERLESQDIRGIQPPDEIVVTAVDEKASVDLLNSIELLDSEMMGDNRLFVRVLSSWGEHAGLDGGAMTSHVYIAVNNWPDQMLAYQLKSLLDPSVLCLGTDTDGIGVVYLEYGLPDDRRTARIAVSLEGIRITEVEQGHCPVEGR